MKQHYEEFKFCPRCGVEYLAGDYKEKGTLFVCHACEYNFFQNSKPTAVLIIPEKDNPENVLLMERAVDPKKGYWDLPGGFLNHGEDLYDGAARELKEELGLEVEVMELFWAGTAGYEFNDVTHMVLDNVLLTEPVAFKDLKVDTKENKSAKFYHVDDILDGRVPISNEVVREAVEEYAVNFLDEDE